MRCREIRASDEHLPSYIDTPKESSLEGLPELAALFELDEFDLSELIKRFRPRRAEEKSRSKRSNALSLKPDMDEKLYKSSGIAVKE
jgi:hypothetical protein